MKRIERTLTISGKSFEILFVAFFGDAMIPEKERGLIQAEALRGIVRHCFAGTLTHEMHEAPVVQESDLSVRRVRADAGEAARVALPQL